MREFTIKLPMRMKINKHGELESLNLNVYRNLHFYKLNYQKKAFQDFVKPLLCGLPAMEAVSLHYEINPKGGSRLDTMNVGSIVDKFFSDALVINGIIPDDDYKHVVGNSFSFGSLCPENPHVLVTITETKPRKETPMRILLDQDEIQQALEAFVKTMGLPGASGVELTVNGDEIQAEIIMNGVISGAVNVPSSTNTPTSDQPPKRRGGRVLGSKNKPKEPVNVATDTEAGNDLSGSGAAESGEEENLDSEAEDEDDKSEGEGFDLFGEGFGSSDEEADGTGTSESSSGSKSNRGNLFGDSDNGSSEDTNPDDEGPSSEAEAPQVTTGRKRPSIFDAD
jgi:hypothetical protein